MSTKLWVYISGPYTKGDPILNTRAAVEAGEKVWQLGHVPVVPHLSMLWHIIHPHTWQEWINYDLELIDRCNLMWRLPGISTGADTEVEHAMDRGMSVAYSLDELNRLIAAELMYGVS